MIFSKLSEKERAELWEVFKTASDWEEAPWLISPPRPIYKTTNLKVGHSIRIHEDRTYGSAKIWRVQAKGRKNHTFFTLPNLIPIEKAKRLAVEVLGYLLVGAPGVEEEAEKKTNLEEELKNAEAQIQNMKEIVNYMLEAILKHQKDLENENNQPRP